MSYRNWPRRRVAIAHDHSSFHSSLFAIGQAFWSVDVAAWDAKENCNVVFSLGRGSKDTVFGVPCLNFSGWSNHKLGVEQESSKAYFFVRRAGKPGHRLIKDTLRYGLNLNSRQQIPVFAVGNRQLRLESHIQSHSRSFFFANLTRRCIGLPNHVQPGDLLQHRENVSVLFNPNRMQSVIGRCTMFCACKPFRTANS